MPEAAHVLRRTAAPQPASSALPPPLRWTITLIVLGLDATAS